MNVLDDRLREHFEKAGTMPAPPLDPDAPVQRARRRRRNRTAAVAVSAILAVVGLAGLISSLAADDEGATRTVDEPDVPEDEPEDAGPEPATITVPESISPSIAGDFPVGSWPFDVAASDKLLVAVGTDQAFCCGTYIDRSNVGLGIGCGVDINRRGELDQSPSRRVRVRRPGRSRHVFSHGNARRVCRRWHRRGPKRR